MGHSFTYPNGYTNIGLDTIDPALTGGEGYEAGWRQLGLFVEAAHQRGIHVLLDIVTWGVAADIDPNRLIQINGQPHPIGEILQSPDDKEAWSNWGGPKYQYDNPLFYQWYKDTTLQIIRTCRLDGLRVDLEPCVTGYNLFEDIRQAACREGFKLVIISEHANDRHAAFDIEQMGVVNDWEKDLTKTHANAAYFTRGGYNMVDCIRSGKLANDADHSGEKNCIPIATAHTTTFIVTTAHSWISPITHFSPPIFRSCIWGRRLATFMTTAICPIPTLTSITTVG